MKRTKCYSKVLFIGIAIMLAFTVGGMALAGALKGDVNKDGVVDMGDVIAIEWMIHDGDVNGDGKVDMADIRAVECIILGVLPGDVNMDGMVNRNDYWELWMIVLGRRPTTSMADINGDGKVDRQDLRYLREILRG